MRIPVLLCLCSAVFALPHSQLNTATLNTNPGIFRDAPADFDCAMRHLAMEFAVRQQPFRSSDSFRLIADGLNAAGGEPGGKTQCNNVTYNGPEQEFNPLFPVPQDLSKVVFVDYDQGDDNNAGTISRPVKTIHHALELVREIDTPTIILRKGNHRIQSVLDLSAFSGLTIQNYNGEQSIVTGAVGFSGTWSQHAKNIYTFDLSKVPLIVNEITGLRRNGARAFRARYPNGCQSDTTPSGYACVGKTGNPLEGFGSSLLSDWVFPVAPTMNSTTEFNPSTPFRPSGRSFQTYQLGIGGNQCEYFTPPAGYWCGNACSGGAPAPPDCIARWPLGLIYNTSILPNSPYADPTTAVVQAWHPGHWASWMFQVSKGNATHLMFANPGFQGARGSYPDVMADTFFVENVLEELDFENEFYYDAKTRTLYYYTENGAPSTTELWEATQLKQYIYVNGSGQENPTSRITIRGITFQNAALTYLDPHGMPSGGDWALTRTAAVYIQNAIKVTIDSCTFEQMDGNAILVYGYARDTVIENNDFHEIGDNIIALWGETIGAPPPAWGMGPDGTKGDQPRFSVIQNNLAYSCGLFEKQSSFYFQAKSCQNIIRNNIFFHGPRAGVNFNDGFGGGTVLEGNLLFSTVMESGDHGPFNSWDRQVYITTVRDGLTPSPEKAMDEIRDNFFIGNYYAQEPVDNDDGSAYYHTHHNVFVYGDNGMKNDFDGHDNHHHDNLYAFIGRGFGICAALPGHADRFFDNTVIQLSNNAYADFDCSCKGYDLATGTCPHRMNNWIFTPDGTMQDICGKPLPDWQKEGVDVNTKVSKWPETNTIIAWAREILSLPQTA